ncbi:MAG: DUF4846 domain-containing protein [Flavobacteriales bacterium]|nr:DUF4846 domain-containing protein [Flavobacteriales bacterium]MCB9447274.1 DUF4846 domain-containing protein [Flavobacteriales bacterium]
MIALRTLFISLFLFTASPPPTYTYPWLENQDHYTSINDRFPTPSGFTRTSDEGFAGWLRHLPLMPPGSPIHSYDGNILSYRTSHAAVIDIDIGNRDLQQCADAVIRLRAEYLYASNRMEDILFHFTSGDAVPFSRWIKGDRPKISGNKVSWQHTAQPDDSHSSLRAYLNQVFTYAGSLSLSRELQPVTNPNDIRVGDVFIRGGSPGHAVLVVDMATDANGRKAFMLAQSYMPAQSMHVLRNPASSSDNPWFYLPPAGRDLETPDWNFSLSELKRFP